MEGTETDADDLERSPWLYPGRAAPHSGLLAAGELRPLDPSHPTLTEDRALVVAVGSNAAPSVLHRKLAAAGAQTDVPFLEVAIGGLGIGHSAHVSAAGYVPAAPHRQDARTILTTYASLLTTAQLRALDATEPNYVRRRLPGLRVELAIGGSRDGCHLYVSRWGLIRGVDAAPLALTSQAGVFAHLTAHSATFRRLARDEDVRTVLRRLAADPAARASLARAFADEGLVVGGVD